MRRAAIRAGRLLDRGLLAYAAADQCARDGVGPAAVVLLDTYPAERMHELTVPVLERMLEAGRAQPELTDETLTAMVAYLGMLREWRPPEPVAPTLLVTRRGAPLGSRRHSTVRPGRTATPPSTSPPTT